MEFIRRNVERTRDNHSAVIPDRKPGGKSKLFLLHFALRDKGQKRLVSLRNEELFLRLARDHLRKVAGLGSETWRGKREKCKETKVNVLAQRSR